MIDSIEEALLRLKSEILAPDWRLSERRAVALLQALAAVEREVRHRRPLLTVCAMARAAVEYLEPRGFTAPPAVLDFLKQTLALLVELMEEEEPGAGREEEILARLTGRFNGLKAQLASGRRI